MPRPPARGEDPPEFVLTDGVNDCVVRVANRRTFRLRVRILDETGAPRTRAVLERGPRGQSSFYFRGPPDWATPREAKAGRQTVAGFGGGSGCGQGRPAAPVDADADGFFELDPFEESGHRGRSDQRYVFRVDEEAFAIVRADDSLDGDSTFVWVVPRPAAVVARVLRPDGTPLAPAAARIATRSDAVRLAWDPPADAWRSVPVRVTVTSEGFEPLSFEWTAATADTPRVLVPRSPK